MGVNAVVKIPAQKNSPVDSGQKNSPVQIHKVCVFFFWVKTLKIHKVNCDNIEIELVKLIN